ncbi:erythromycin esterase family protein [Chitinophaga sp. GCM10012297]|uniref:Erythromycin esterase family protein n=1 Tax=Chitinophaga chungangae TaxID=2821488 RepID=A0ABS3YBN2_9BACT|nr:erythromycin esterase family protein [Chitinophaga chungangae]MBO9152092.1 erythromycin esterase family protein [Chitinophaga chungangae]
MKLSLLLLLIPFTALSQEHNFDFEKLKPGGKQPEEWGLPPVEGNKAGYTVLTDTVAFSGKYSVAITQNSPVAQNAFGAFNYSIPATFKGQRVTLEGYIKTEDVKDGHAALYLNVVGTKAFDNMNERGVTGTTDWHKYSIELALGEEATSISFGALFTGRGKVWIDNMSLNVDGKDFTLAPAREKRVPPAADLAWLKQHALPLRSVDANTGFEDLAPVGEMIGDARIVSLGEPTHGTSEAFRMKHRLLEYLVKEKGFDIFSIEANMPECRAINDYVLHGDGDPKKLLDTMYFWTWNTQEVLDMITWMRAYNAGNPKKMVQFTGFDMQFPGVAATELKAFLAAFAPAQQALGDSIAAQSGALMRKRQTKRAGYEAPELQQSLAALKQFFKNSRQRLTAEVGGEKFAWAMHHIAVIEQFAQLAAENTFGSARDSSMAENVDWLVKRYPGSKLVLWAHNGHVSKAANAMGGYLEKMYGKQMVVMGFAAAEGTYTAIIPGQAIFSNNVLSAPPDGSFEWYGRNSGLGNFVLDLRKENLKDPGAAWLLEKRGIRRIGAVMMQPKFQFSQTLLPNDFDAVIYLDKTTASQCFRAWKGNSANK